MWTRPSVSTRRPSRPSSRCRSPRAPVCRSRPTSLVAASSCNNNSSCSSRKQWNRSSNNNSSSGTERTMVRHSDWALASTSRCARTARCSWRRATTTRPRVQLCPQPLQPRRCSAVPATASSRSLPSPARPAAAQTPRHRSQPSQKQNQKQKQCQHQCQHQQRQQQQRRQDDDRQQRHARCLRACASWWARVPTSRAWSAA